MRRVRRVRRVYGASWENLTGRQGTLVVIAQSDRQADRAIPLDDLTPTESVALVALASFYVPQGVLIGRRERRVAGRNRNCANTLGAELLTLGR